MDILDKDISKEASVKVSFDDGKLVFAGGYDGAGGGVGLTLYCDAEYILDQIAAAIPGKVDDAILFAIKAAMR